MKYWNVLLKKQREQGKDGLTLPYLIGSQNYLTGNFQRHGITELIEDILSDDLFEVNVRYCMNICALIFEIKKDKNVAYFPAFNGKKQDRLSISISLRDEIGETVNSLTSVLTEMYQDKINQNLFSAKPHPNERSALWNKFSTEDETFIRECFRHLS
jgi:hypothetical protein